MAPATNSSDELGRMPFPSSGLAAPIIPAPSTQAGRVVAESNPRTQPPPPSAPSAADSRRSEAYYEVKSTIFGALIEAIDLAQLAKLDVDSARE
jgi:pilus assembly protein CpaF